MTTERDMKAPHLFTNTNIKLIQALHDRPKVDHGTPILLRLMENIIQKQLEQISARANTAPRRACMLVPACVRACVHPTAFLLCSQGARGCLSTKVDQTHTIQARPHSTPFQLVHTIPARPDTTFQLVQTETEARKEGEG